MPATKGVCEHRRADLSPLLQRGRALPGHTRIPAFTHSRIPARSATLACAITNIVVTPTKRRSLVAPRRLAGRQLWIRFSCEFNRLLYFRRPGTHPAEERARRLL